VFLQYWTSSSSALFFPQVHIYVGSIV
jgi:hypothetical protein